MPVANHIAAQKIVQPIQSLVTNYSQGHVSDRHASHGHSLLDILSRARLSWARERLTDTSITGMSLTSTSLNGMSLTA